MQHVVMKDGTTQDIDAQSWRLVDDEFLFFNVITNAGRSRVESVATVPVETVTTIQLID